VAAVFPMYEFTLLEDQGERRDEKSHVEAVKNVSRDRHWIPVDEIRASGHDRAPVSRCDIDAERRPRANQLTATNAMRSKSTMYMRDFLTSRSPAEPKISCACAASATERLIQHLGDVRLSALATCPCAP
jgi:hypothetical protein